MLLLALMATFVVQSTALDRTSLIIRNRQRLHGSFLDGAQHTFFLVLLQMLIPQPHAGASLTQIPSTPHAATGLQLTQTCS